MLALSIGALLPLPATAGWTTDGVAIAPTESNQIRPRIVTDDAGGAIIVWEDARGGALLAFAQRLAGDGSTAPGWPVSGVLIPNRGHSLGNLTLTTDGAGGGYVASDDSSFVGVVMVHHLGRDGLTALGWPGDIVVLQEAPYGQSGGTHGAFLPALLADESGGVFVTRTYRDRLHQSIALTRLTSSADFDPGWDSGAYASGAGWDFPSVLCSDGQGGVFLAFQDNVIPPRILIDRFSGLGNKVFAGNAVSPALLDQTAVGLVSDGGTGAIVTWEDHRNGVFDQVFAQRILSDGAIAPGWPATGLVVCAYPTSPGMPSDFIFPGPLSSICPDGTGGAYVAWTDYRDSTGTGEGDIYAQHVLGDGTFAPVWPVDGLAICTAPGDQRSPIVSGDGQGGLLLTWQDARNGQHDIYAQRVDASGSAATSWPANGIAVCTADGDQRTPQIINDGALGAIIAWEDGRGPKTQIYASRVTFDGTVSTLASLVRSVVTTDAVRLEWFVSEPNRGEIEIERRTPSTDWSRMARVAPQSDGLVVMDDRDVQPSQRYGYRLLMGSTTYASETWVVTLSTPRLKLDQPQPNPTVRGMTVSFSLPDASPARIELLDVGGRRIQTREVGSLGAGQHVMPLLGDFHLAPGTYLVRLSHGSISLARKIVVTR
jgi:hypothetical protein